MRYRLPSAFAGRARLAVGLSLASVTALLLSTACGSSPQPTQPGPSASPSPNVSIVSMAVTAETLASGAHVYHVTAKLRESGGAAATVASIDLSFVNGSAAVTSSHIERPISDAANVVAANATIDTREMTTTDNDPSHPHATSVTAKVNYSNGGSTSTSSSATGSAEVPVSAAPRFALSGHVMDDTSGGPVRAGSVEIVDGANAGKQAQADSNGSYTLTDLAAGSATIRASASGYEPTNRSVMVAQDTSVDLRLRRSPTAPPPAPSPSPSPTPGPSGCAYTVSPPNTGGTEGGTRTATITRTSGTCSWQASTNVSWVTFPGATSGNGSGTLTFVLAPNGLQDRSGNVTISWAGGSFNILVQQAGRISECRFTVRTTAGDVGNIPSAGGQFTLTIDVTLGDMACPIHTDPQERWITLTGGSETTTLITRVFTVAPNPTPGTSRSAGVLVTSPFSGSNIMVTQR